MALVLSLKQTLTLWERGLPAGAWRSVQVRGERRLLVPLLLTGCKLWHLRKEGIFYPKLAWQTATSALPDAAQVLFLTGRTCLHVPAFTHPHYLFIVYVP